MKAKINYKLIQDGERAIDTSYVGILNKLPNDAFKLSYTNENKEFYNITFNQNKKSVIVENSKSIMIFEKKLVSDVDYRTAFGIIKMQLSVHNVEISNENKCIIIRLTYDLIQANEKMKNDLEIIIEIK